MAAIISWQFMAAPDSCRTSAAASRALTFLGLAAPPDVAAALVSSVAEALTAASAARTFLGLAGAVLGLWIWSVASVDAAFAAFFFLLAMMLLPECQDIEKGSASTALPAQDRTVTSTQTLDQGN